MNIFKLPDLGEGLVEAEIRQWHVSIGEQVKQDQPLLSVETDKAVVEIPSPHTGQVTKLFGDAGQIVQVGNPLVEFSGAPVQAHSSDSGTVVGQVETGKGVLKEEPTTVRRAAGTFKATPAVRALARQMQVDLAMVTPSGAEGTITSEDVRRVAKLLLEVGPVEPLHGVRRVMALTMSRANAEVASATVVEDADIHAWASGQDVTIRLVRAIVAGCKTVPSLNAWYDSHVVGRRLFEKIDLGIAVNTEEGLFVPVLRDVGNREREDLRRGLEAIKDDVRKRTIPPQEMRDYTITLSNFGSFGGRYAAPVVVPPTVAILGAGRVRPQVVAVNDQPKVHRVMPLSLAFDHRAATGVEAVRFLDAAVQDLEQVE